MCMGTCLLGLLYSCIWVHVWLGLLTHVYGYIFGWDYLLMCRGTCLLGLLTHVYGYMFSCGVVFHRSGSLFPLGINIIKL